MADSNDTIDGYTFRQLLGAKPVSLSKKQQKQVDKLAKKQARIDAGKRSPISTVVGAPFRLLAAIVKVPAKLLVAIAKLPGRLLGAIFGKK